MEKPRLKTKSPLEKDIQKSILTQLRKRPGSFTVKLAAGPYSLPGLPDILHIESGVPYFFEVKRPGGKATPLQEQVMEQLRCAGALVYVVTGWDEVAAVIDSNQRQFLADRKGREER